MAERLEDGGNEYDGDAVKDNDSHTLLARAEMWDPLESLHELEQDIIRASQSAQSQADKWDVYQACMELLDHGDKIRLLQRAQFWYIVACMEDQQRYDSVRECLDEADICMHRLQQVWSIEEGEYGRVEPLAEAIREKRREVNEADRANFPRRYPLDASYLSSAMDENKTEEEPSEGGENSVSGDSK